MADPIALTMSGASLLLSVGTFAWLNRRTDAVMCTLVAGEPRHYVSVSEFSGMLAGDFQFSFANLGTRPVLLRQAEVNAFCTPELQGEVAADCTVTDGRLPQIIKAGDMCSIAVHFDWTPDFVAQAREEARKRGEHQPAPFFVARAVFWNPKGRRMVAEKHIASFRGEGQEWTFDVAAERSFPAVKMRRRKADRESVRHRSPGAAGAPPRPRAEK